MIKLYFKILFWYFIGSIVWFFLIGMMPATSESKVILYVSLFYLTVGLLVGVLFRDFLQKKPWLTLFLPIVQIIFFMF